MAWLGTAALVVGAATAASAAPAATPAPLVSVPSAETVPGEYIVVLKSSTEGATGLRATAARDRVKAAAEHGRKLGAEITHQFKGTIQGYSAGLSPTELAAVRADPEVAYVQPNRVLRTEAAAEGTPVPYQPVHAAGTVINPESWGLDRVD